MISEATIVARPEGPSAASVPPGKTPEVPRE
jgi:hypothetical protein